MSSNFEVSMVLPSNMIIKGADSHLYRIGLSLFKCQSEVKRKIFLNPFFVFCVVFLLFIKEVSMVFYDLGHNSDYHLMVGNVDHFMQTKGIQHYLAISMSVTLIGSQLLNLYNKRKGIEPTYLRVFQMMSGLITPQSIGLKDKHFILKVIKYTRISLNFSQKTINLLTINSFFMINIIYSSRPTSFSLFHRLFLSSAHSLFWAIWVHYIYCVQIYQFVYFIIISFYLRFKLREINSRIIKRERNVLRIFRDLIQTYKEIKEYDTNYWSKFLLLLWLTFLSQISLLFFFALIIGLENTLIRVMILFYAIADSLLLLLTVISSSLIHFEANLTNKHLYTYYHSTKRINLKARFKVIIGHFYTLNCLNETILYRLFSKTVNKHFGYNIGKKCRLPLRSLFSIK